MHNRQFDFTEPRSDPGVLALSRPKLDPAYQAAIAHYWVLAGTVLWSFVLLSAVAFGGWLFFTKSTPLGNSWGTRLVPSLPSPLAPLIAQAPVDTCKEMAERLQAKGVQLDWTGRRALYPSIYLFGGDLEGIALGTLAAYAEVNAPQVPTVVVVQYPDAAEAKEIAGTRKNAFSWGRFLLYEVRGDGKFLQEIKGKL